MKTYKTYKTFAECKLENPECDVYLAAYSDGFCCGAGFPWVDICSPEQYLMSVYDFLEKGFKLVVGDIYLSREGKVITIKDTATSTAFSSPAPSDKDRYILKTKALEDNTLHSSNKGEQIMQTYKTYKTFSECKLAHPECDVFCSYYDNKFSPEAYTARHFKCKPSDYLMNLVDFLEKGLDFTGGDAYLDIKGDVVTVKNPEVDNTPIYLDKETYILKAKELDDPIMTDIVKENATKLAAKKDTAPEVRQACRNLIETINKSELLPKAYELYCEFYGEEAVDFDDFEMREWNNKVWLHFAKKLQEVENEHQS